MVAEFYTFILFTFPYFLLNTFGHFPPSEIQGEKEGAGSGAASEEEAQYADDFEDYDSAEVGMFLSLSLSLCLSVCMFVSVICSCT